MSPEQRKAPAHGSSSLCWCHSLKGDIAGTLKWKGIWILWDKESPQLSTSLGILVRFGFLLDLKSFFALCDGWLDYWYREPNNYQRKLTDAKMTPSSITKKTFKKLSFVPLRPVTKYFLDWTRLCRAWAYKVLNADLLMCSFHLFCCLSLIKISDALWNILGFFFLIL